MPRPQDSANLHRMEPRAANILVVSCDVGGPQEDSTKVGCTSRRAVGQAPGEELLSGHCGLFMLN